MESVCLKLLNMSITAGWLILAVIVLRFLLRRAPKWISCLLWALVAVRLICPFSFESAFSLIPSGETVSQEMIRSESPSIDSGVKFVDNIVNPVIRNSLTPKKEDNADNAAALPGAVPEAASPKTVSTGTLSPESSVQIWFYIASAVWCAGASALLAYAVASYLHLWFRMRTAVRLEGNVYVSEFVDTPFILGVVRPRIYLPAGMEESLREPVVAHERAHLSRGDHLWKQLGYLLLAVYWFQPLCWAAYALFCRDIEFACDEKVIRDYDPHRKKRYSEALLACSVDRRAVTVYPLAFGEVSVKQRIKSVLHYKKPAIWLVAAAVIVCGVTAACLLTDPVSGGEIPMAKGQDKENDGKADPDGNTDPDESQNTDGGSGQDGVQSLIQNVDESQELWRKAVEDWIQAFVSRDGEKIAALASEELEEDLQSRKLLTGQTGSYGFGDSDAWPRDAMADVSLREITEERAVVFYYAWDALPHITVWKETLTLEARNGAYVIAGEEIEHMENIAAEEDFFAAYKGRISNIVELNNSRMNYRENGAGEELNRNALLSSGNVYRQLFEPESAACALLNLSRDEGEVRVERLFQEDGAVGLQIYFVREDRDRRICMIQPYGQNGIWIPQDYFVNPLYRFMQLDWDEVKNSSFSMEDRPEWWQDVVCIGRLPEKNIALYGYNDEECFGRGVAVASGDDVRYFDWIYATPRANVPEYYWDGSRNQLQIVFTPNTGTGEDEQELHILQYDTAGVMTGEVYDRLGGDGWYERVLSAYDGETKRLTLTDSRDAAEIASFEVDEEKMGAVTEVRMGSISHFSLGEKITLKVEVESVYEEYGLAHLCTLEAEVIYQSDGNGTSLRLGEIRLVQ